MNHPTSSSTSLSLALRTLSGGVLGYALANGLAGSIARFVQPLSSRADAVLLASMPGFAVIVAVMLVMAETERPLRLGGFLAALCCILLGLSLDVGGL